MILRKVETWDVRNQAIFNAESIFKAFLVQENTHGCIEKLVPYETMRIKGVLTQNSLG